MFAMYFFTAADTPVTFYLFSALAQFFFSGFNTAIYAVIPDCVEYGEWKTGLRNDGFQYAFISLGNKVGMAIGTSLLAAVLEMCGYVANQQQKLCGTQCDPPFIYHGSGHPVGCNGCCTSVLPPEQNNL